MAFKTKITMDAWKKKLDDVKILKADMNKLVMDFLVSEGWIDAAEQFKYESGTERIDLATIMERCAVRKAVWCGNIEDAIKKINELNPEILDKNPRLFFRIQQQRFIESIRDGNIEKALEISQEELAPCAEKIFKESVDIAPEISAISYLPKRSMLEKLERTVALLAFEDPTECPTGKLMKMSRRQKTAREVNSVILTSQGHEKDSKLSSVLKTLLWAQNRLAKVALFPYMDYWFETEELTDASSRHS